MAVEKLILRSILYGADKIPDSWFEKLPGGYYRDADGHKRKIGDKNPKKDSPKPTSKGRKAGSSDFYPDRNYSERDHLERGRQRDRDRDRERRTSSYDGGADDADEDFYYYREDGRPHRSKSYRRRRSAERDRHGHKDGSPRERFHEDRHRGAPSPSPREPGMGRRYPTAYIERPSVYVQPPYFEAEAAAQTPQYLRRNYTEPAPEQRSPSQIYRNGPINNGYVPYAHVYGTARQAVPRPEPSPGAFFEDSDLRSRRSPIAPYPQRYQQTRSNQQAPVGAAEHGAQSASNLRNARIVDGPEALHSYRRFSTYSYYDVYIGAEWTSSEHQHSNRASSGGYVDEQRPYESQKPMHSSHRNGRYRSDVDGSYERQRQMRRHGDGYYSG